MSIKKAIIPAAGFGTRFLPATKAVPKELLPVLDKPVIQYVVEEAVSSGVTDICIIISPGKEAIRNHFSPAPELEARLARQGKNELLAEMRRIHEMAAITFVYQMEQKGLGHAINCAGEFAGSDAVAVLLGDTLIESETPATAQLAEVHRRHGASVVLCEDVPSEKVSHYGIIDPAQEQPGGIMPVRDLVEKPSPQEAPSTLAVAGRYIFTPAIFECIRRTPPGRGGEIQITDAMRLLLAKESMYARRLDGIRHDIGNPAGLLAANAAFAGR